MALVLLLQSKVYAFHSLPTERTVRIAVDQARAIALTENEAAGALFFAFARRSTELGAMWPLLPYLLARSAAEACGFKLATSREETDEMRLAIAEGEAGCNEVVRWFRERQHPIGN